MEILEEIGKIEGRGNFIFYKVRCPVCAKDPELFGDAIYVMDKYSIRDKMWKCGCSKATHWTEEQYRVMIRRANPTIEIRSIVKTKAKCFCPIHNHEWTNNVHNLTRGQGCVKCYNDATRKRRTHDNPAEIVNNICNEIGYKFNGFVSEYVKSAKTYLKLTCDKGHDYESCTMSNFVKGKRCPMCTNAGFDPGKPASLYIFKWKHDDKEFIKYGITNRDAMKDRVKSQNKNTNFKPEKVVVLNFNDGRDALNLEREFDEYRNKVVGNHGYIDKESFPDGYTETLPVSCLNEIKGILLENTGVKLE